jgi:hypothetical protein
MAPGHRGPLYTRGRSWFLRGGAASLSSLSPFRFGLAPFPASVNLISGACFYAVRPIGKQLTSDDSCGGTANCSWCCRKRKRQHQSKAKRRSAYSRNNQAPLARFQKRKPGCHRAFPPYALFPRHKSLSANLTRQKIGKAWLYRGNKMASN